MQQETYYQHHHSTHQQHEYYEEDNSYKDNKYYQKSGKPQTAALQSRYHNPESHHIGQGYQGHKQAVTVLAESGRKFSDGDIHINKHEEVKKPTFVAPISPSS